jgi:hypothetical protein
LMGLYDIHTPPFQWTSHLKSSNYVKFHQVLKINY